VCTCVYMCREKGGKRLTGGCLSTKGPRSFWPLCSHTCCRMGYFYNFLEEEDSFCDLLNSSRNFPFSSSAVAPGSGMQGHWEWGWACSAALGPVNLEPEGVDWAAGIPAQLLSMLCCPWGPRRALGAKALWEKQLRAWS
jgi:hypothetical protein